MSSKVEFERIDLTDHANLITRATEEFTEDFTILSNSIWSFHKSPKTLIIIDSARDSQEVIDDRTIDLLVKSLGQLTMEFAVGNLTTISKYNTEKSEFDTLYIDDHLRAFVDQFNIQTVIMLGSVAYNNFSMLPESYYKGKSATALVNTFPYFKDDMVMGVNYHPQFILKNGGVESDSFQAFSGKFKRILQKSKVDINASSMFDIRMMHLDKLDEFLDMFRNEKDLATDYEANDLDPWNISTKPTGFSIATEKKARYMVIDRPLNEDEKAKIVAFFEKKSPWTYNCKYEMKMTWSKMGKLVLMNDVLVLCTVDGHRGSLKDNSRFYLESDIWEEDVHFVVGSYDTIFSILGDLRYKNDEGKALLRRFLKGENHQELIDECEDILTGSKLTTLKNTVEQLLNVLTPDEISSGMKAFPKPWGAVAPRVLSDYCCMDSINTVRIKQLLWDKHKAYYSYYIIQSWLACIMESYGMVWDNQYADSLELFYIEDTTASLAKLLKLLDLPQKELEYVNLIERTECGPDVTIENNIGEKVYQVKLRNYYDKLDALKGVFNPLSNKYESQLKFWDSYKTDECLPIVLLNQIETEMAQSTTISEEDRHKLMDRRSLDSTLQNLVEYIQTHDQHSSSLYKILEGLEEAQTTLFKGFSSGVIEFHYHSHSKFSPALSCKACKTMYYNPEEEGTICPKCNNDKIKITRGVDPDNKETWTKEFWMINFIRRFKKVNKSRSTYIQGQVGRGNVYLGKYKDFHTPPTRLGSYWEVMENFPDYKLKSDERWIMNTDFNNNAAETLRWTARIHTVPWNCILGSEKIPVVDETTGLINKVAVESLAMLPDKEEFFTFSAFTDNKQITPSVGTYARHVKDVPTLTLVMEDESKTCRVSHDQLLLTEDGSWIKAEDVTEGTELHVANMEFMTLDR